MFFTPLYKCFQRLKAWEARERKKAREYEKEREREDERKAEEVSLFSSHEACAADF